MKGKSEREREMKLGGGEGDLLGLGWGCIRDLGMDATVGFEVAGL